MRWTVFLLVFVAYRVVLSISRDHGLSGWETLAVSFAIWLLAVAIACADAVMVSLPHGRVPGNRHRLILNLGELGVTVPAIALFLGLFYPIGRLLTAPFGYASPDDIPQLAAAVVALLSLAIAALVGYVWWRISLVLWLDWGRRHVADPLRLKKDARRRRMIWSCFDVR